MKAALVLLGAAAALMATGEGRSLSYRMKANEPQACFYAHVEPGVDLATAKVQFYYSATEVRGSGPAVVAAVVAGPSGAVLKTEDRKAHAEINIDVEQHGQHSICIKHVGSPTDKNVDLDITVPDAVAITPPISAQNQEAAEKLIKTITKLQGELGDLVHTMRYIKSRERRNLETVESIESWIFYLSVLEVVLIIAMSLFQVTILQMFFSVPAKSRF